MKGWNPFGKVDMEVGSFLKVSPFNKQYIKNEKGKETDEKDKTHTENSSKQELKQ